MKHPVLVIVLNSIAIVVLCSLLVGAIVLHQNGGLNELFSGVLFFDFSDHFFATDDSYRVGDGSVNAGEVTDIDLSWMAGSVQVKVGEGD